MKSVPSKSRGFALIVSLLLLGFILLLILSLSSLVSLETRSVTTHTNLERARCDALLGLQVALGNLQKYTGPDQRVTATADIMAGADPAKLKYTGVWDADPDSGSYGQPLAWLASQRATPDPASDYSRAPNTTYAVELVSARRTGQVDEVPAVKAELVDVMDNNGVLTDQFAWWVGDEGVKARVNLANSPNTPDAVAKTLAERSAIEGVFIDPQLQELYEAALVPDDLAMPGSALIHRFARLRDFAFLGATQSQQMEFSQEFTERFHEITPYSLGLFTNTREGGFRYDLTTLFEKSDTDFEDNSITQILARGDDRATPDPLLITDYNPDGVVAANLFGVSVTGGRVPGPTWNLLRDYYRQYMRVDSGSESIEPQRAFPAPEYNNTEIGIRTMHGHPTGLYGQWHVETLQVTPWGKSSGQYPVIRPTTMKIHPVITEMQYLLSYRLVDNPNADSDATTPDDYEMQLVVDPIITLWNPYDIDLDLSDHALTLHARGLPVKLDITIDPDGSGPEATVIYDDVRLIDLLGGKDASTSYRVSLTGVTLPAGAVATYSPNNITPSPQHKDLSLSKGWNQQGGFYAENINNGSKVVGALDATGKITVGHDDTHSFKDFFTRVWLMDISLGGQFDTIGDQKPQSFELCEIEIDRRGYIQAANAMTPVNFSFVYTDPLTHATSLDDVKTPFALIRFYLKAEDEFNGRIGQYTPMGYNTSSPIAGITANADKYNYPAVPNWGIELPDGINGFNAVNDGFYGSSRSASGESNLQVYDIPRSPLHSLAQLQNADHAIFPIEPMHVIGNSYASPYIPANDTINEYQIKFVDMSYYENRALWDRFFFSTATDGDPATAQGGLGAPDQTAFGNFLDDPLNNPLPNARIWPLPSNQDTATIISTVFSAEGFTDMAQYVGVRGGFNINSTNLESWRAILSGTRGKSTDGQSDFSRFSDPDSVASATGSWAGFRSLTDAEVEELAQEIVTRISEEGPFMSLADFINRDPDASSDVQRHAGLLQRAIDATDINAGFSHASSGVNVGAAIETNGSGKSALGAATYVSQADLLTPIGSFLTSRSDTFHIRSVGRSIDPLTQETVASAYLEAVVQRIPTGPGSTDRRYVILEFRWLEPSEI